MRNNGSVEAELPRFRRGGRQCINVSVKDKKNFSDGGDERYHGLYPANGDTQAGPLA